MTREDLNETKSPDKKENFLINPFYHQIQAIKFTKSPTKSTEKYKTQLDEEDEEEKGTKPDLILLNSLNRNSIPISLIGGDIRIPKLAVAQQLADGVASIKILRVPKIGALPTRDNPSPPPPIGPILDLLRLRIPVLLI